MILKKLTLLQMISMEQRDDLGEKMILEPWMKHFWTVLCLRHRAPYHCGGPDPFRTTGQTFVDFSNYQALKRFWKMNNHGAFSILRKALDLKLTDQNCHHET